MGADRSTRWQKLTVKDAEPTGWERRGNHAIGSKRHCRRMQRSIASSASVRRLSARLFGTGLFQKNLPQLNAVAATCNALGIDANSIGFSSRAKSAIAVLAALDGRGVSWALPMNELVPINASFHILRKKIAPSNRWVIKHLGEDENIILTICITVILISLFGIIVEIWFFCY